MTNNDDYNETFSVRKRRKRKKDTVSVEELELDYMTDIMAVTESIEIPPESDVAIDDVEEVTEVTPEHPVEDNTVIDTPAHQTNLPRRYQNIDDGDGYRRPSNMHNPGNYGAKYTLILNSKSRAVRRRLCKRTM